MFKKKKKNLQFGTTKNGYNILEVDNFLASSTESNNKIIQEQKLLIEDLKAENQKLIEKIEKYITREEEIKKVLLAATEKATDMRTDLKLQYALEIERLKIFQAKWTNAYQQIKDKYNFGDDVLNMESVVQNTALELENLLNKDFGIKLTPKGSEQELQFKSELERLNIKEEDLKLLVEKLKAEIKEVS